MTEQETVADDLLAGLESRLKEIHATASVPYKATGKMAYVTTLSEECLDMIGQYRAVVPDQPG